MLRYNRSNRYADLVLETPRSYAATGALPVAAGVVVSPARGEVAAPPRHGNGRRGGGVAAAATGRGQQGSGFTGSPAKQRAGPRTGGSGAGGTKDEPAAPPTKPAPPAKPTGPVEPLTTLLTTTEAVVVSTLSGLSELLQPGRFADCVADRTS